jgi:hypothetical protein
MSFMRITNLKMGKFLKKNILDTISKKYNYSPDQSVKYLKDISEQLLEVQVLISETKKYMGRVKRIKDERAGIVFPFKEGDDYWIIEDGEVVYSIWDDVSEELYRQNSNQIYFENERRAKNYLKRSQQ